MKYVKLFEAWTEELVEEVPHQDLYETMEELLDAWKSWKENDDEDKDEEALHDEFMEKLDGIMDKVKDLVQEEKEEENEDDSEEPKEEEDQEDEKEEEDEEEKDQEDSDEEDSDEEADEMKEGIERPTRPERDLSTDQNSITARIEPLISLSATMSFPELLTSFLEILDDPTVAASTETREKWRGQVKRIQGIRDPRMAKAEFQKMLANVYLAGSGMRATPRKRNY